MAFGLREPVGDGVKRRRVRPEPKVARTDDNVFSEVTPRLHATAPRHNAVARAPDRGGRRRRSSLQRRVKVVRVDAVAAGEFVEAPCVRCARMAGERRAERDDETNEFRRVLREFAGVDAADPGVDDCGDSSGKDLFLGVTPSRPPVTFCTNCRSTRILGCGPSKRKTKLPTTAPTSIGAAHGGHMGITTSSGPGIALKGEAIGLAIMMELPLLVINIQRGGPSTGLPTKTEQADLFQAILGRNGESPMPVIAARSPSDCFDVAQEASGSAPRRDLRRRGGRPGTGPHRAARPGRRPWTPRR